MKAQTMRRLRQLHHFVGVFFAPAIILFALSGALQTFRWHEAEGYGGAPPRWIVWMASVHKDQSPPHAKAGHDHAPAAAAAPDAKADHDADDDHHHEHGEGRSPLALKIFVLLMAVGLIVSASLGMAIALNTRSTRRISIIMLVAGAALPLVLLLA